LIEEEVASNGKRKKDMQEIGLAAADLPVEVFIDAN
jgi:hypothetical protein